jgi:hypothetical protein
MTDKREQLIALCQLLGLAKTIKDYPAELIDAVLCENARINAECVKLKQDNVYLESSLSMLRIAVNGFLQSNDVKRSERGTLSYSTDHQHYGVLLDAYNAVQSNKLVDGEKRD